MQRRSHCIWPLWPAQCVHKPELEASLADCGTPAAPLAAAANHFPIGITPAAAASPPALLRSWIATWSVVGRAIARSVIGAGTSVGPGNAEPQQRADGNAGRHAAVSTGLSGTGRHRAETQDQCQN